MTMMSAFVFAQHHDGHRGGRGENSHREQIEKMKTALALNDEQYASIKSIDEKYRAKHHALKRDSTLAKGSKASEMKAIHKERQKEIASVLTKEQQTKWKAFQKAQAEARKADRQKAKAERAEKMKTALSLSDEQATKMEKVNKDFHQRMKSLKKNDKSKEENMAAFKKYRDEHEADIKSILTAEQFEKFQTLKQENRSKRKHRNRNKR
jgi:DNA repair exonuclease SbcCD ATPase subunit